MHGIVIFPHDDHYRPMIATWTCDLCSFTGSLMDKTGQDKVSIDMTDSYGFEGLSIHIARFHSQIRTGGGLFTRQKYLCRDFG